MLKPLLFFVDLDKDPPNLQNQIHDRCRAPAAEPNFKMRHSPHLAENQGSPEVPASQINPGA